MVLPNCHCKKSILFLSFSTDDGVYKISHIVHRMVIFLDGCVALGIIRFHHLFILIIFIIL